jgi:hypothetical protein
MWSPYINQVNAARRHGSTKNDAPVKLDAKRAKPCAEWLAANERRVLGISFSAELKLTISKLRGSRVLVALKALSPCSILMTVPPDHCSRLEET